MNQILFFSVIIPTYNRDNIDVAIQSVLSQTFCDYEIIVVDDHSDVPAIERCACLRNEKIHYFYLEQNGGAAVARNYGIEKSQGEYIAFLDDDDEWYANKLDVLYECLRNNRPDLVYHNVIVNMVYEKLTYATHKKQEESYWPLLLYRSPIGGTPSVAIKRDLLNKIGCFDEALRADEDGELFTRIAKYSKNIICIEQVLGVFNVRTKVSSLTKTLEPREDARRKIEEKYKKDIECLTSEQQCIMREVYLSAFSYAMMLNYNKKAAFKYSWKAFLVRGNFRYLGQALLCFISIKLLFFLRTKM